MCFCHITGHLTGCIHLFSGNYESWKYLGRFSSKRLRWRQFPGCHAPIESCAYQWRRRDFCCWRRRSHAGYSWTCLCNGIKRPTNYRARKQSRGSFGDTTVIRTYHPLRLGQTPVLPLLHLFILLIIERYWCRNFLYEPSCRLSALDEKTNQVYSQR